MNQPATPGIVSDEIDRDFTAAARIGKRLGIRRYEIRNLKSGRVPMCDAAEITEVEQVVAGEGLEITGLSPGLFKWTDTAEQFERDISEIYPRSRDLAKRWNVPGLITFGFHKPGATEETGPGISSDNPPSQIVDWLARAGELAMRDNLLLMIEPEIVCWCDSGSATAALIHRARASSLRINYDPGNVAWLTRRDPIDEFPAMAKLIANVHVKDVSFPDPAPTARPKFVPAGRGIIDFRAHFKALRESGYTGHISLEPHMDGSEATIRECLAAFTVASG